MKEQTTPMTRAEMIANRKAMQAALMAEIHRKGVSAIDVAAHVDEAKARLKRPKLEKDEYTPPKPADWVTAFIVSPTPRQIVKEQVNAKARKHVACQSKKARKSWGKAGHQFSNKLTQSKASWEKFQNEVSYAR